MTDTCNRDTDIGILPIGELHFEGLCAIVYDRTNNKLYVLLLDAKDTGNPDINPHYARILLEWDKLDDYSQTQIRTNDVRRGDVRYGQVDLNSQTINFTFSATSPALEATNIDDVSNQFIELKKVYLDKPEKYAKPHKDLLSKPITSSIRGVKLESRIPIDKGVLLGEENSTYLYYFPQSPDIPYDYKAGRLFCARLTIGVNVSSVKVGNNTYNFSGVSPKIIIENLPSVPPKYPGDDKDDIDFDLVYKLLPGISEKRLPKVKRGLIFSRPMICGLAWLPDTSA